LQEFASYLWNNVATPNMAFTHPGVLSLEAMTRLSQTIHAAQSGPLNARRPIILEEGMKAEPLAVSAEDSEVLESRRFAVLEICRLFNVPPMMVADFNDANFATSSNALLFFANQCIAPWCQAIEREFARSVFGDPERFHLELDLSGMIKGDYQTRASVGINLVRSGVITPNELRGELGWDRHPDGDKLLAQSVGGRPEGTADGAGDALPAPGAPMNGSGKGNGVAAS
jgi:HK97 family phage portal protein